MAQPTLSRCLNRPPSALSDESISKIRVRLIIGSESLRYFIALLFKLLDDGGNRCLILRFSPSVDETMDTSVCLVASGITVNPGTQLKVIRSEPMPGMGNHCL